MQDKAYHHVTIRYARMRIIYVNMQHHYVDMQHNYVDVLDNFKLSSDLDDVNILNFLHVDIDIINLVCRGHNVCM